MDVELRHLRYFVAVARELSFTRAAHGLGMSQPPLGQQIRDLERELGVRLLERTRRRVTLTEAGSLFLGAAERTLEKADAAMDLARRAGRGEAGTLGLGFVSSASYEALPRLLRPYRARRPEVQLSLRQLPTAEQVEAIADGTLHAGLLGERPRDDRLAQVVLERQPVVVALPADHLLAARPSVRLRQLAREPFIVHPRRAAPGNYDRIAAMCRRAGFSPRIEQESEELHTRVGLVAAGMGVAPLPASARHLDIEGAVFVTLEDDAEPLEIVAAWRADNPSPLLAGFVEVVRDLALAA